MDRGGGKGSGDSGAVGADHAADLQVTGPAAREPHQLACCKSALLQPRCQGASSPRRLMAVTRRTTIHCGDAEPPHEGPENRRLKNMSEPDRTSFRSAGRRSREWPTGRSGVLSVTWIWSGMSRRGGKRGASCC
jgi:hypothetical protein